MAMRSRYPGGSWGDRERENKRDRVGMTKTGRETGENGGKETKTESKRNRSQRETGIKAPTFRQSPTPHPVWHCLKSSQLGESQTALEIRGREGDLRGSSRVCHHPPCWYPVARKPCSSGAPWWYVPNHS